MTTTEGYARWAEFYDEPGNQLLELEQPVVREILDGLPIGIALDAACGTGRHTAYLASLGHKVIGIDTSPEMLARARENVPGGEFHQADLHEVPLADHSVDLVVCGIALSHAPDLERALAELVRVLRPNGHLVISDSRGLIGDIGLPLVKVGPEGNFGYMPTYARLASDYLAAALPLGLHVRRCEEPRRPSPLIDDEGIDLYDGVAAPAHVREIRRTSGRCTDSRRPRRTPPTAERRPPSSGTSSFPRGHSPAACTSLFAAVCGQAASSGCLTRTRASR